jgi:hypothetical protein
VERAEESDAHDSLLLLPACLQTTPTPCPPGL